MYKGLMQNTRCSCRILTTLKFSSTNVKIPENPPSGSRIVPCGQTDGHDEASSRF
jgi:hypothetical protein